MLVKGATGRCGSNYKHIIFKLIIQNSTLGTHLEIDLWCHKTALSSSSNIGSGKGFVLWGNKPLPEPMLTDFCHCMVSLGHNTLINTGVFIINGVKN